MCDIKKSKGWFRYRLCEPTAAAIEFRLDDWGLAMAAVAVQLMEVPWWQWTPDTEGNVKEYELRARVTAMIRRTVRDWHRFARSTGRKRHGRVTSNP